MAGCAALIGFRIAAHFSNAIKNSSIDIPNQQIKDTSYLAHHDWRHFSTSSNANKKSKIVLVV